MLSRFEPDDCTYYTQHLDHWDGQGWVDRTFDERFAIREIRKVPGGELWIAGNRGIVRLRN